MVGVRRHWPLVAIILGSSVFLTGLVLLVRHRETPIVASVLATPSPAPLISDFPSTAPATPSPDGERIQVPQLGIDLPIVAGDGYNAPLYKAATYPTLKLPGQGGRSFIYAHARVGMFDPLFRARVGQEVDVVRPGAPTLRYHITEYYGHWPVSDLRWLQPADHEELVLSTCTTYNYNDPRIVAVAEPL